MTDFMQGMVVGAIAVLVIPALALLLIGRAAHRWGGMRVPEPAPGVAHAPK